jgi:hypothetical protein
MFSWIPDPDFYPSGISDPGIQKQHQKRRGENLLCPTIFCSHKYHKIVNNFIKNRERKYGFGIRDPEKTYPESRVN